MPESVLTQTIPGWGGVLATPSFWSEGAVFATVALFGGLGLGAPEDDGGAAPPPLPVAPAAPPPAPDPVAPPPALPTVTLGPRPAISVSESPAFFRSWTVL